MERVREISPTPLNIKLLINKGLYVLITLKGLIILYKKYREKIILNNDFRGIIK